MTHLEKAIKELEAQVEQLRNSTTSDIPTQRHKQTLATLLEWNIKELRGHVEHLDRIIDKLDI